MIKKTITFRQTIYKTIEFEGECVAEIKKQVDEAYEDPDSIIDFEKNFDAIKVDATWAGPYEEM